MTRRADHILSFARTLDGGGVERALLRLARGWIAAGRRVTLVLDDAAGPLAAELPPGIDLVLPPGRARGGYRRRLPGVVRDRRPDLLFCPGNAHTLAALWARVRLGPGCPPMVAKMSNAVARGDHGRVADAGHRMWLSLHGRFLDHLVAMTPATAAEAAAATGMAGRTSVIANPPPVPLGVEGAPLPPGRILLGVGRLAPQKRWDRLIDALPRLADRDTVLVIQGEGPERSSLLRQAERLGIGDRVHLPGHHPDPLAVMAAAAVVALVSDYEGVPGVLREALSVGTPVVATDSSPAIGEIVAAPSLGTIVLRDDPAALVAALDAWLAPDTRRPDPVAPPGTDSADRYLALFDRIVAATPPRPRASARPGAPARP